MLHAASFRSWLLMHPFSKILNHSMKHSSGSIQEIQYLLDNLGSPWYAGPRSSRRLAIAQI